MRIAQVMGKMNNAGVEAVVMNYFRHIDRTKVQFDFIVDEDSTCVPQNEIESLGGRVFYVPPYQRLNRYLSALIRLFREQQYPIVHAHLNTLSVFPLYAAKKAGVPVRIAHSHSTAGKGEWKKNILKYTLRPFSKVYATHYAACSRYAGAWLFGKKAMERGQVTIFNNAIDLEKFRFNPTVRDEVRKELGIENKFVVGHVGRFCYQKNQEFLIDIFAEVSRRNPDAVLLLIGEGKDRAKIEDKVSKMNLAGVLFLGNRDDMARLYQAMDVLVLPSRYEGLPVVGVEAQAAGLPCILSDRMTKETKMTDTAVFLNIDNGPCEWADAIQRAHELPPDRYETALHNAAFSIEQQGRRLLQFYLEAARQIKQA